MKRIIIVASAIVVALISIAGSTAITSASVPAPSNLHVYEVGSTYAKVSWGPSVVGPLSIKPYPNGKGATISWGASTDDLAPTVTYDFSKDGSFLWRDLQQTYADVSFSRDVRMFSTCVIPHSQNGYGPERCVTWNAN